VHYYKPLRTSVTPKKQRALVTSGKGPGGINNYNSTHITRPLKLVTRHIRVVIVPHATMIVGTDGNPVDG
jgi:hypothetical protein